jgi:hypothetical protein
VSALRGDAAGRVVMKVYVLLENLGPEGDTFWGVYSTLEKAHEAARSRTWGDDWDKWGDAADPWPMKRYTVREVEVDGSYQGVTVADENNLKEANAPQ